MLEWIEFEERCVKRDIKEGLEGREIMVGIGWSIAFGNEEEVIRFGKLVSEMLKWNVIDWW